MLAEAVGREAMFGNRPARLSSGDIGDCRRRQYRACDLRDDIAGNVPRRTASARPKADRDGGVEMPARDVADGIGHGEAGEAEGQRNANEPEPQLRACSGPNRAYRRSVAEDKGVSVSVDHGGSSILKKKHIKNRNLTSKEK